MRIMKRRFTDCPSNLTRGDKAGIITVMVMMMTTMITNTLKGLSHATTVTQFYTDCLIYSPQQPDY